MLNYRLSYSGSIHPWGGCDGGSIPPCLTMSNKIFLLCKNIYWSIRNKEDKEFLDKCIANFKKDNFAYVYKSIESFDNIYGNFKDIKEKDLSDMEIKLITHIFNIDLKRFESRHNKTINYKHYNMKRAQSHKEEQINYFTRRMISLGCKIDRDKAIVLLSNIYKNSKYA